jgi:hypothetical protein
VLNIIKSKGWHISNMSSNRGFLKQEDGKLEVVGASHIQASLGSYPSGIILTTDVAGFWGFDEHQRLMSVWVWKVGEGP